MRDKVGLSSIPKYLTCVDIWILLLLLGIFEPPILRGIKVVLEWLILNPESFPNSSKTLRAVGSERCRSDKNNKVSSAHREIEWTEEPNWIGVICLHCLMNCAMGSIDRLNIRGERGHPCLVPLQILKISEVYPLVDTLAIGLVYRVCIILMNWSPKLNFFKVYHR